MGFRYLAADENVLYGAAVTNTAGTVDTTHDVNWLCDGRDRPCRWQDGTAGASAVGTTARAIGLVVLHSHTLDPDLPITISGGSGLTGAGTAPAARRNGIPTNPGIVIATPVTTDTVQFGVAGNAVDVVVAEMLAGPLRELTHGIPMDGMQWGYIDAGAIRRRSRFGSVTDLDLEVTARWMRASILVSRAEMDDIAGWYEGTRNGTRPSACLPLFDNPDDVWVIGFTRKPSFTPRGGWWIASLEFEEWPRQAW